jgi:3-oxoacyl-[acyl-carrier protein] reductase
MSEATGIDLSGQTAIVTGGSRGIGREVVLALARHGAGVAVVARSVEGAESAAAEARALGVQAEAHPADVTDPEAAKVAVSRIHESFGTIDILVNNAGIARDQLIPRLSPESWREVLQVNLEGCFLWTRAVCRTMMKQRRGRIINISSVIGLTGNAGQSSYAASKAGMIAFTRSAAQEFASRGILVNAIAPGFIETDMTDGLPDEMKESTRSRIPLRRFGDPGEVAAGVVFLASSYANYIVGHVLRIDGGLVMQG